MELTEAEEYEAYALDELEGATFCSLCDGMGHTAEAHEGWDEE